MSNLGNVSLSNTNNSSPIFGAPIIPQSNTFQTGIFSSFDKPSFDPGKVFTGPKKNNFNFDTLSLSNPRGNQAPPPVNFNIDYSTTTNDYERYVANEKTEDKKYNHPKAENIFLYIELGFGVAILATLIYAFRSYSNINQ